MVPNYPLRRAVMPRGDGVQNEYRFADGEDDSEDIGYGGGGASRKYDDDDDDEGGWATHRETDDLWDSTDDLDDEEAGEPEAVVPETDEDEEDAFGRAPTPRGGGAAVGGSGGASRVSPGANAPSKPAAKAASKPAADK